MSIPLFKRRARVVVGSTTFECGVNEAGVTGLDIEFDIKKTLRGKPNTCELHIFNLNPTQRAQLAQRQHQPRGNALVISAGYEAQTFVIFSGDILECHSENDLKGTYTTIFLASDGHRAHRTGRVAETVPPGMTAQQVVELAARAAASALGGEELVGNLGQVTAPAFLGGAHTARNGSVLSGNAMSELHRVCRSVGYEVSIQNGVLQFSRSGEPASNSALRLLGESGLIKAPSRKSNGVVEARCLLIPDLAPGRKVRFDSEEVRGNYRVEGAKYTGSTVGNDWFIDIECKELS